MKKVLLLLLSTLVGILSGCSAGKLSVPSGILATDQTVADEYMTDNSFLTARYGSDYTVTFVGGSGEGEVNQSGKSGIMSFQYMINDTDLYDVEVRFLYKGIIINHNKKTSQPTLKRRFFKKKAAFFSWPGLGKEWC